VSKIVPHSDRDTSDLRVTFKVGESRTVSGLLRAPSEPRAGVVLAHGAGAGMLHASMEALAAGLAERHFATFRYQFPYMEGGGGRPDPPRVAHATVRAAVAEAARLMPNVPLIAGGRSFGGRMTSQAQAASPLPGVLGLVFFAFPLHPPKQISGERGLHLSDVHIPMLFLQGSRDAMADRQELSGLVDRLGDRATSKVLADADHSFHVPARFGKTGRQIMGEALDAFTGWFERLSPNKC
jgi:predicted alpha/beta-hydrolase family hydrolase